MNKYKVKYYPNVDSYITIVEANSVEEAIEQSEEEAKMNTCFYATEKDVEILETED